VSSTVRYALVGAGMMGAEHIRNLAITPGAELVAIVDPVDSSARSATAAAGKPDLRRFDSSAELARSGIADAVIIASPNNTHREVLAPLFDAGLNILCEKPVATTLDDARWVAERAAAAKGVFWTAMEYRYMPPAAEFIAQIKSGRIGALKMLAIREHRFPFLEKVGDWNRFAENTGGTMVEKCCHFFDLMRLIVGAEPVRVYCSGGMDVNHIDERYDGRQPDIIDNSYTTVDFANGVRAMLDLSMFADGAENQEEITAVGDVARLDCLIPDGSLIFSPRVGFMNPKKVERSHVPVDEAAVKAGSHHGATFYEHQKFIAAVRGEGAVEVTAEDGLRAVAIGIAAETSAKERRVVEMTELGFGTG
jgi:myo-inositol 2-dehydrogenase / D-chiro-inositol 1-dehydrogenase